MRIRRLATLFVAGLLFTTLLGCQNSPGQVFSPTSDLHVVGVQPAFVQPKESSSSSSSSSSATTVTLPAVNVYFRITNGVSAFLENYQIRYLAANGQPLANGRFDHAGALSVFLQAAALGGGTASDTSTGTGTGTSTSTSSGGGQTIISQYTGYCAIEVMNPAVHSYMTNGTASYTDDISPVVANVTLRGRDLNDHALSASFNVTLSTTVLVEEN
ncbi:MAG: hypothetical protein OZSIB_3582 [Candidatus Ozemobacter sibiricus]|jgi:hypothetical protein|uniref:Lipoprotein n=1 Tax=Candidatus Ozemobacter sibiricus TaxID=2268124 RepID=A0A367ZPM2_9BACT|nr:MAG: hypothetical protein OZSIB_3582 [Candidatus Ozemobacter sibiricus]